MDTAGNAYVTAYTYSSPAQGFPVTVGPDLTHNGGQDVFVAKVNAAGTALVYCGYIGGSSDEAGQSIALDGSGNAYVTGYATSTEAQGFPVTVGPDLTFNGAFDTFVAKIDATGATLAYCGYIGALLDDVATAIAVDGSGNAYVAGYTTSSEAQGLPVTVGPDLTFNGTTDVFVAKVNAAGTALVYCGYVGGSNIEFPTGIAVDGSGSAYVSGYGLSTEADGFPVTVGPDLTQNGSYDAFVAKINAAGTALVYCGFIGGSGLDAVAGVAVDGSGNAYVFGETSSTEAQGFPVGGGLDSTYNGGVQDAFVAKINAAGMALVYCGYIGGSNREDSAGIAIDAFGHVYVVGDTTSTEAQSFPVTVGPDLTFNGGARDAFVAKINGAGCCALSTAEVPGSTITVTGTGQFQLRFNAATGAGIDQLFDLVENPGLDLAGGTGTAQPVLLSEELRSSGFFYRSSDNTSGGRLDLLEATPVRTRVRGQAFYQEVGTSNILGGVVAVGDHTVYGGGRLALKWDRRTFASVPSDIHQLQLSLAYAASGPLNVWAAYSDAAAMPPGGPAGSAFLLARAETVGNRTDFLKILSQDWALADSTAANPFGSELFELWWNSATARTLPASEVLNSLTYFRPTNLGNTANPWLDLAVTSRSADYRSPSAISVGPGAQWQDANENTSTGGDFFNESEAAYVFDLNPATGLTFDMDGSGPTRYAPFFKIRHWRSFVESPVVTFDPDGGGPLPAVSLRKDVDYKAAVKPVARGYSAERVLWHCTLEDATACDVSGLDIGSTGGVSGVDIVPARYGNGALINAATDNVDAGIAAEGNFSPTGGRIEFWYQPTYNHDDGAQHALWSTQSADDCFFFEKAASNELRFSILKNATPGPTASWGPRPT